MTNKTIDKQKLNLDHQHDPMGPKWGAALLLSGLTQPRRTDNTIPLQGILSLCCSCSLTHPRASMFPFPFPRGEKWEMERE